MFEKKWIFKKGGRPVIYQSDGEFQELPDRMKWRHARYEPHGNPPIDFTWEREWRINSELEFGPDTGAIVVPDVKWVERLVQEHEAQQDYQVLQYSTIMDEGLAEMYRDQFPWRVTYFA
jgi:hypothetical protein